MHLAIRVLDNPQGNLFMLHAADPLKDVAQRPMPQIVQQGRHQTYRGPALSMATERPSCSSIRRAVSITPMLWL